MEFYLSLTNPLVYNKMRDRLIDLSRQYSIDEIVRLEKLAFKNLIEEEPVALRTGKWALGTVLSDEALDAYVRRIIRQLRLPAGDAEKDGDFIIGASWDPCGDDDDGRASRRFDDVEDLADFYNEMEAAGRNPHHTNTHGPRGWVVTYDRDEGDD